MRCSLKNEALLPRPTGIVVSAIGAFAKAGIGVILVEHRGKVSCNIADHDLASVDQVIALFALRRFFLG